MQTLYYSILHFLVDGLCAYAVFARFTGGEQDVLVFLLYNFCAFAMQLPLGTLMDLILLRRADRGADPKRAEHFFAFSGLILTVLGAVAGLDLSNELPGVNFVLAVPVSDLLGPVVLGLGNALFHLGGGVATIRSDRERGHRGRELGIFVAPGALGLFIGTCAAKNGLDDVFLAVLLIFAGAYLIISSLLLYSGRKEAGDAPVPQAGSAPERPVSFITVLAVFACFFVVILRSFLGFSVSFAWKDGFVLSLLATLAVVLGKMLGGILSARFSPLPVMVGSLIAAALCFLFGVLTVPGLLALLFFNMTMPVTLELLVDRFRGLPGFSFGLLTLALFLGFVPVLLGWSIEVSSTVLGGAGALLSLGLLLPALLIMRKETAA